MLRFVVVTVWLAASAAAQGPLQYEMRRTEKKSPGCLVSFEYPEVTSAASPKVRDRINAGLLRVLLRRSDWPAADSGAESVAAYMKMSFDNCAQFHNWAKGTVAARDLYERKVVTVFRSTAPVFSLRCQADEDGGGVHPFGTTFYINFEIKTGEVVKLLDILRPGALEQLTVLAESHFRQDYKLSATESLSEIGFRFPNDQFRLNDNYGIGDSGLVFHFNTYEIGPGAMGETEVEIPYAEMRQLLKPGTGLVR
jgi:hypothetical protein